MTAIVLFVVVHVTLALLVPHTLVAMVTGGPEIDESKAAAAVQPRADGIIGGQCHDHRTPSRSIFRPKRGIDQDVLNEPTAS